MSVLDNTEDEKTANLDNYRDAHQRFRAHESAVRNCGYGIGIGSFVLTVIAGAVMGERSTEWLYLVGFAIIGVAYAYYLRLKDHHSAELQRIFEECVHGCSEEDRSKALEERWAIDSPSTRQKRVP